MVDTNNAEDPFVEEAVGEKTNLAGRSVVLLKEVGSKAPDKERK
jgi:hypothetical protein